MALKHVRTSNRVAPPKVTGQGETTRDLPAAVVSTEVAVDHWVAAEVNDKLLAGTPSWKRLLDLTIIILLLPLWSTVMLVIAGWIKLVSPGPIFFRQERIGYLGRRFVLFKLRTMKWNIETESHERYLEQLMQTDTPMTKLDHSGDPRIIPGGRILRALGLDELPQLFNVLRGEMSLVGPRPCTPNEFDRNETWQRARFHAPPGLTGYWQVSGKNKTTFREMVKLDIYYSKNMSLLLDLTILLRTFPAIATQLFESEPILRLRRLPRKPVSGSCRSQAN